MYIIRWYLMTKYKEDVIKLDFIHIKGGVILQYNRRVDGRRTTPQTKNGTFISKYANLILQGLNSINKYLETETRDL